MSVEQQSRFENKVPIARFIEQLGDLYLQFEKETKTSNLISRIITAFIGPIEANRLYKISDGSYNLKRDPMVKYFERNAVIHGYLATLMGALSLIMELGVDPTSINSESASLISFGGLMLVVGLQRFVEGLDKAQPALNGIHKPHLNKIISKVPFATQLNRK